MAIRLDKLVAERFGLSRRAAQEAIRNGRVDLAGMRPRPTKVVANLPYGVAAGALLRTIEELPEVELWVAMVQREVGERLAIDKHCIGEIRVGGQCLGHLVVRASE